MLRKDKCNTTLKYPCSDCSNCSDHTQSLLALVCSSSFSTHFQLGYCYCQPSSFSTKSDTNAFKAFPALLECVPKTTPVSQIAPIKVKTALFFIPLASTASSWENNSLLAEKKMLDIPGCQQLQVSFRSHTSISSS